MVEEKKKRKKYTTFEPYSVGRDDDFINQLKNEKQNTIEYK